MDLIEAVGFLVPILIDQYGTIILGHGRVLAATSLGMAEVPAVRVEHLTPALIKVLRIADNKITENAGWDPKLLRAEIKEAVDMTIDVDLLGFEPGELDVLICDIDNDENEPEPEPPSPANVVSQTGDIYEL